MTDHNEQRPPLPTANLAGEPTQVDLRHVGLGGAAPTPRTDWLLSEYEHDMNDETAWPNLEKGIRQLETELAAAKEWQQSILGLIHELCKHQGFDHEWGGDKNGWGFCFEWIKWVQKRAEKAKAALAATNAKLAEFEQVATADTSGLSTNVHWLDNNRALNYPLGMPLYARKGANDETE